MKVPPNYIEIPQWVKTETESHWQNMHQTDVNHFKDNNKTFNNGNKT